jgi:hypothetical protein
MNRIYFNKDGIANFEIKNYYLFINLKNNDQVTVREENEEKKSELLRRLILMLRGQDDYVAYYDYDTDELIIE